MLDPDGVSIGSGNYSATLCVSAFGGREVEPPCQLTQRRLHVIQTDVEIVLGQSAVVSHNIRTRTGQVAYRQLADTDVQIFNARAIAAHIKRVEIVDLDVLAAIVSLACPEFGVWLALEQVAHGDEGFT